MAQPRITFFCDLEPDTLQKLFADPAIIDDLPRLQAGVRLALLDLSPGRAAVVRRLNDVGIPVIAGLLLPKEQGLFLTMENAPQAVAQYTDFKAWTAQYGLRWTGVGLDIELDIREFQLFASNTWQALLGRLRRAFDNARLQHALAIYRALVAQMHADGYCVDSYQFPSIVDVRQADSRLAQRVTGLLDIPVDREVLMTYSSVLGPLGPAIVWSYAQDAQSVAVGLTGSGAESEGRLPLLDWDAFARDLLYARRWSEDIAIFSLEGCVKQGFMERLKTFDWDQPVTPPPAEMIRTVTFLRKSLQGVLWCSAHPFIVLGGLGSLISLPWLLSRLRSRKKRSRKEAGDVPRKSKPRCSDPFEESLHYSTERSRFCSYREEMRSCQLRASEIKISTMSWLLNAYKQTSYRSRRQFVRLPKRHPIVGKRRCLAGRDGWASG